MAEANQDALLVVLSVAPLETEIALMVEMPLALRLVDRLLGGGTKFSEQTATSLTDLETVIVRRALESIVEPLSATWLDLADVSFSVSSVQTSPMTFQLVPPSEPVLILVLDARIDGLVSPLSLCIPYRSVEAVIDRFEHRHYGLDEVDAATADQVRAAVSKVGVELRAEVGAVQMQVTDVLSLAVGDVIRLHRRADSGVVVYAGESPTFVATPGRNGRLRAVQVRAPWMEYG
jgi:flagellar motor switch protein FliM